MMGLMNPAVGIRLPNATLLVVRVADLAVHPVPDLGMDLEAVMEVVNLMMRVATAKALMARMRYR
jgi:hypothetical protein